MKVVAIELTSEELAVALMAYVQDTYELKPDQIIIKSLEKEIEITILPRLFLRCDEIVGHYVT